MPSLEGLRTLDPNEVTELGEYAKEKKGQRRNRWVDVRFHLKKYGSVAFPFSWLSKKQKTSSLALASFIGNTIKKPDFKGETIRYGVHNEEVFIIWDRESKPSND